MQGFSSRVHACSEILIRPFQTGSHQTNQKTCQKGVKNLFGWLRHLRFLMSFTLLGFINVTLRYLRYYALFRLL